MEHQGAQGRGRARARGQPMTAPLRRPGEAPSKTQTSLTDAGGIGRGVVRQQVETKPDNVATKIGKGGTPIELQANYFRLVTMPGWQLYQYRVDLSPEEDRTSVRKAYVRSLRERLPGYLFDGTVLYTSQRLGPNDKKEPVIFTISNKEGQRYQISMRRVGDLAKKDFGYIQVFNMLIRRCLEALELKLMGRDYYDPKAMLPVPAFKLQLWPGYKTSIRQHENDVLMCVEVVHKVMRAQTVRDLLIEFFRAGGDFRRNFLKHIVGSVVLTKYNNKTYRVDDVDFETTPACTFSMKGQDVSYSEYMLQKYNIKIQDLKQPMLVSRAKARDLRAGIQETIYLIPEVCNMTGLTDNMRANWQLMRSLALHTRVAPDNRIQKLLSFNQRLSKPGSRAVEELTRWEMTLEKTLVKINGRKFEEEHIILGNNKQVTTGTQVDWTMALRKNEMLDIKPLQNWVVVTPNSCGRNNNTLADAKEFVTILQEAGNRMGFPLAQPQLIVIQDDRVNSYVSALSRVLDTSNPQLIMCVATNNRGDRYSAIKKKCCVDRAVPVQVILSKNLKSDATRSVAMKVAIQINCKIGGAPWSVHIPLKGMMVVGFDVCHDTTNKALSYGAMVASLNKTMTRYYSAVTAHTHGEELSNHLAVNIIKAVGRYKDVNAGVLPANILIYRDGVGEGQIPYVHATEVENIQSKLKEAYGGQDVKMTFVVVTKRIKTRIFQGNGNPFPGTVVDDVITDPTKYDFFLVSQSVRDGTVSPTSYNVLCDGMNLPPERLQQLTYKFCHLYFNWSGTVRVPAPVQYAHKLAFLVGQSLHREPSSALSNLLYFL